MPNYIKAYISKKRNNGIVVFISKSNDGFFFRDTDDEGSDLQLNESMTFEETCDTIKKLLTDKATHLPTFFKRVEKYAHSKSITARCSLHRGMSISESRYELKMNENEFSNLDRYIMNL